MDPDTNRFMPRKGWQEIISKSNKEQCNHPIIFLTGLVCCVFCYWGNGTNEPLTFFLSSSLVRSARVALPVSWLFSSSPLPSSFPFLFYLTIFFFVFLFRRLFFFCCSSFFFLKDKIFPFTHTHIQKNVWVAKKEIASCANGARSTRSNLHGVRE